MEQEKNLKTEVFEALGAASMCWSDVDKAGEFQSERAIEIGEELMGKISDLNIEGAMDIICAALNKNKSFGSYFYSWQCNIAVAFQDAYSNYKEEMAKDQLTKEDIHKISNEAAINFLNQLLRVNESNDEKITITYDDDYHPDRSI